MSFSSHVSHRPHLGSIRLWTWAVLALSLGVCLSITFLHYSQETRLHRSRQLLRNFREARIDLAKGFLNLTLANNDPRSPFRPEEGIAWLNQAMSVLKEADTQFGSSGETRRENAGLVDAFRVKAVAFREQLLVYGRAKSSDRRKLELPLLVSFHELENLAQRMDAVIQADLTSLGDRLDTRFTTTLIISAALLGTMCLCVHQVGKRQQEAEAGLRQSEGRLRALSDNLPGGALYQLLMPQDGHNRYTYVSTGFERIFGMPGERILADPKAFWELIVEADHVRMQAEEVACARRLSTFEMDFRQRTTAGEVKWIHTRATPQRLADGSTLWDGVATDITERKRAEEALRLSETHLRSLVNTLPDLVWLKDPQGVYLACNPRFESFFGAPQSEIIGKTDYDFMDRALADSFRTHDFEAVRAGGPRVNEEEVTFASDGHRELLETIKTPMLNPDGSLIGVLGISRDITQHKRAEVALRESEERLRLFVTHAPASLAMLDSEMRYLAVSQRWIKDYHLETQSIIGLSHYEVFPEISEGWKAVHRRGIAGEVICAEEDRFERGDGTVQWLRWEVRPWRTTDGKVGGIVIFSEDITDRKQTAMALEESEARFRSLVETTFDWIWELNEAGRYTYVSAKVKDLLGYDPGEVLGLTPLQLMPEAEAKRVESILNRIISSREPFSALENINRHKSGRLVALETSGVPIFGSDGQFKGYRGMDRDITERKLAEAGLRAEANRLAVILDAQREIASANLEYAPLIDLILERMSRMTGAEGASLEVAEGEEMVYRAATGSAAPFVGLRLKIDQSLSGFCMKSCETIRVDDAEEDSRADRKACRLIGLRSMFLLPLRYDEHSIGVLKLISSQVAAFAEGTEFSVGLMGEFLSATIARKQAETSLHQQRNELQARNEQLERFNRATVGRELRMIELKQEVNELCRSAGLVNRYAGALGAGSAQSDSADTAAADEGKEAS